MADIAAVETAMVNLIAGFLGLGSNYQPGAPATSAAGQCQCRVYRGWPIANHLDIDLAANISNVSVFPVAGATIRTTKYLPQWSVSSTPSAAISASITGASVAFAGSGADGQAVGVRFGPVAAGRAVSYRMTAADTTTTIASGLAALIPNASASGNILTLPSDQNVMVRVAVDATSIMETRRQNQSVWVIGWCHTPAVRDAVIGTLDSGFANMTDPWGRLTYQFALSDGSYADMRYLSSHTDDMPQQANLWRRDLRYNVDYPTIAIASQTAAIFSGGALITDDESVLFDFGDTQPSLSAQGTQDGNSVYVDAAGNLIGVAS